MTSRIAGHEMTAADVMSSPVISLAETSPILEAANLMLRQQIRHIVVVNGTHCIGVLTDRDLLETWYRGPAAMRTTIVRGLVANRTSCVLPDAALRQVARVMNENQVDAVPVVEEGGELLGLITAGDVVHAVAHYGLVIPADAEAS